MLLATLDTTKMLRLRFAHQWLHLARMRIIIVMLLLTLAVSTTAKLATKAITYTKVNAPQ